MPGVSCRVCDADAAFLRTVTRPDYETTTPCVRIVDLFAGGGGLSLGMAEAARRVGEGTDVVLAVEQHRDAARVFARNFPKANVIEADVATLFDGTVGAVPTMAETRLREQVGSVDVLLAGPPCQGHSDLNNHTRREDPRNDLYVRVARAAEVLVPAFVLVENVATIEHDRGAAVPRATAVLERAGYSVATALLDLAEFGVPQRRRRHILLASGQAEVDPAAILSVRADCECNVPRTVEWAIADLLDVGTSTGIDASSVPSPVNLARMTWLIDNDEYDLPNVLRPKCHHAPHSYLSMYGRLRWDGPAQTITTGYGSMGQGRYVHPARARTITPHEAARLQTLPDFFDLRSSSVRSTWSHVIGNAVPPLLGVHLGVPLLQAMSTSTTGAALPAGDTDPQPDVPSTSVESTRVAQAAVRSSGPPPASHAAADQVPSTLRQVRADGRVRRRIHRRSAVG
jgi:DNA (cytosine-5)-methyltransferase 1